MFNKYKTNELNKFLSSEQNGGENEILKLKIKKEFLNLIFLKYKKIFHLVYSDLTYLSQFKTFFYINDKDENIRNVRNLIDYYFAQKKHRLIILFSFLQKIHNIIEIKIKVNITHNKYYYLTSYQLNLLKPEYIDISKNSMNYFSSLIDYKSRETKLRTIYNYIECIIYDINRKKWQKGEHKVLSCIFIFYPQRNWPCINDLAMSTYKFWEVLNLLLFLTINIILIIKYNKSRNEEEY